MSSYLIRGKSPVEGRVRVGGNKNAALACLYASLLTDEAVILSNIPEIEDVKVTLKILESVGRKVARLGPNCYRIEGTDLVDNVPKELSSAVRASILLAGAFVARRADLTLPPPGGDVIGLRRLDTHFGALRSLGASCSIGEDGNLRFRAGRIQGGAVFLEEASVTATENALMAASLAEGASVIYNAACEPHVQDLCRMLARMGCKISGTGSNLLRVEGAARLSGCEFAVGFDYMEAGSFIGLAGAAGGEVRLDGVDLGQMRTVAGGFEKIGIICVEAGPHSVVVPRKQSRLIRRSVDGRTIKIDDAPWPGFPTDILSIITVAATQMRGLALIHEKMFESRMYFVDYLIRMGADIIQCDPHRVLVSGPRDLVASPLLSPDVRAGMALVVAAVCARGTSKIQNVYQIERGYENLEGKLRALGVQIERIEDGL